MMMVGVVLSDGVFVSVLYQVEFPGHRVLRVLETNSALRRNVATLPATSTEFIQVGPWWSIEPREQFLSIIFHDIRPEEPVLANRLCLPFETTAVRILHAGGDRRGDPDGRVGDEAARIRSDQKVPPNHSSERFSFELEMDQSHPQYSNREWSPPFSNSNILGEQIPSACLCLRRASRADRAGCVGHRPR
jgi:hypothetical protein